MSNLWFGEIEEYTCEIHPVVSHMIIQHYLRKTGVASNCIGLLLGTVTEGLVQICQALPINIASSDEKKVSLKQFGEGLMLQYNLMRETYPKYSLVGIYTLGDLHIRYITIIQTIEKGFSASNLLLYKLKPTESGFESQSYLLMRLKLESLAVFKSIPTKIMQEPLEVLGNKEKNTMQVISELKEYLVNGGNDIEDKAVAALLGKAELELKGLS